MRRKEAGNVFGEGSKTPISITLLVKNPKKQIGKAAIHYCDMGDYLSREKKLETIRQFVSISNVDWKTLSPNKHGDWISQRNDAFLNFISIESEKKFDISAKSFFIVKSRGLETARDAWIYNSSNTILKVNIKKTVKFYNEQVAIFANYSKKNEDYENFIVYDTKKISWSSSLLSHFKNQKKS